jgi:hypothetical protein
MRWGSSAKIPECATTNPNPVSAMPVRIQAGNVALRRDNLVNQPRIFLRLGVAISPRARAAVAGPAIAIIAARAAMM